MPELILYDTVGILALQNKNDPYRAAASLAHLTAYRSNAEFYVTEQVLLEYGNATARSPHRRGLSEYRSIFQQSGTLIAPTPEDIALAWSAYSADRPGGASIVDHISFLIMKRFQIRKVFSDDRHFREAGFETLF
jgi:predicted nucleic acid-binding protein